MSAPEKLVGNPQQPLQRSPKSGRRIIHGGSGYGYEEGCRCEECIAAHSARIRRRREERRRALLADPTLAKHGSASTYNNWGCRCEPCVEAHSERMRSPQHLATQRRSRQRKAAR